MTGQKFYFKYLKDLKLTKIAKNCFLNLQPTLSRIFINFFLLLKIDYTKITKKNKKSKLTFGHNYLEKNPIVLRLQVFFFKQKISPKTPLMWLGCTN